MQILETKSSESGKTGSDTLKITEMFLSLQGEGSHSGLPCYFIRTSGCDLRCSYCDTDYAFTEGRKLPVEEIIESIPDHVHLVQITGGEPMLQEKGVIQLINKIYADRKSCKILLETGGHRSLANIPDQVHIVMDIKLPGSGEENKVLLSNLNILKKTDEIKFVIQDRNDFLTAVNWIHEHSLTDTCQILMSPVYEKLEPDELARWILSERLNVRLMLQLHKIIWGEKRGV